MNTELFALAVTAALRIPTSGIGTLSEKKIHAALKYYVQPDKDKHEIKFSGGVADALSDDGVFEIQTRDFYRLTKKLEILLKSGSVTVVYPIVAEKTLYITDTETGLRVVRKSPQKMNAYNVFNELYGIRRFLNSENLHIRLITVKAEENKAVRFIGKKRKVAKTLHSELIPTELLADETLKAPSDYLKFIPSGIKEEFTSADFSRAAKISREISQRTLLILSELNVVSRVAKSGNAYVYRVSI